MLRMSHAASFAAGALFAVGVGVHAAPRDQKRFQTLDTFAHALSMIETSYVDPVDEQKLLYDASRGMLHNLDKYSTFLPPQRYERLRQDTEGEFGGVGVTLAPGMLDEQRPGQPPYPTIDDIVLRSPAELAGLQLDDRVVAIENAPTAERGHEVANAATWEARLRGASGTRVTLSILRAGWTEPRSFTLVRAQVKQPTVEWRVLEKGIGLVAINRFAEATSADTAAALAALRDKGALESLVLDLRNNPGGLVDQAVATADLFLDGGTIVTIKSRANVETQTAHKGGIATKVPVTILVDQGTASASEILSGCLRDHGRAKLVGLPTYGKGTVQTFFDLADGSGLKLTTARYFTPKGNSLESKGLTPDVRVEAFAPVEIVGGSGAGDGSDATIDESEDDDDPQLGAAVKLARAARGGGSK